jgi:nicotinamide mononucleotide (NMN) deamidase PncC
MEIARWEKGKSVEGYRGQMVRVTRGEALRLIESLSRQLRTGDANDGRAEFTAGVTGIATPNNRRTKAGEEYFSVVVAEHGGAARRNAKGKRPTRKLGV